ncbi:MAG TPA: hypothetical protein PLF31_00280 [Candidatus Paceibacterota bacterium]|nr:hypothetical protein [Candidatus Paceibacterota bacterium]
MTEGFYSVVKNKDAAILEALLDLTGETPIQFLGHCLVCNETCDVIESPHTKTESILIIRADHSAPTVSAA